MQEFTQRAKSSEVGACFWSTGVIKVSGYQEAGGSTDVRAGLGGFH
uniref:Uncharacterized protein n=1 Tax=Anguilla anguilla TaxID=7936 RepID=A0A0E9W610_ANGAN